MKGLNGEMLLLNWYKQKFDIHHSFHMSLNWAFLTLRFSIKLLDLLNLDSRTVLYFLVPNETRFFFFFFFYGVYKRLLKRLLVPVKKAHSEVLRWFIRSWVCLAIVRSRTWHLGTSVCLPVHSKQRFWGSTVWDAWNSKCVTLSLLPQPKTVLTLVILGRFGLNQVYSAVGFFQMPSVFNSPLLFYALVSRSKNLYAGCFASSK